VEIKPINVNCEQQLLVRTQVAEHNIHQHSPDWKFIILYDQKIFLSPDQEKKFALLRKHKHSFADILKFQQMDGRYCDNKPFPGPVICGQMFLFSSSKQVTVLSGLIFNYWL